MKIRLVHIAYDDFPPYGVYLQFDVLDGIQDHSTTPHIQIESKSDDIAGMLLQEFMNTALEAAKQSVKKEEKPDRFWTLWLDKESFDRFNSKEPFEIGKVYSLIFKSKTIEMDIDE